jgi:hypothetical protein
MFTLSRQRLSPTPIFNTRGAKPTPSREYHVRAARVTRNVAASILTERNPLHMASIPKVK